MQLLCSIAGGLLVQLERLVQRDRVCDRMKDCLLVAESVNKALNVRDFEHSVKHLFGNFFGVNTVRVLFFDDESQRLLSSPGTARKRDCTAIGIDKGIVGLCARKQQLIHVASLHQDHHVDAQADGLQRSGRPVSMQASMLVGPLLLDSDQVSQGRNRLVGVVQLLERKKSSDGAFSQEEQELFQLLLGACTQAARKTLKVQELGNKLEEVPSSLTRMLST
jgi:hypothetical protein